MAESVLSFQSVTKTFPGPTPVHAVNGVSFEIEKGGFAALIGPSGSGKTTLLNMASGLDRPTEGKITLAGQVISHLEATELCLFRRRYLGFVFQSYNLFSSLTALENVEFTSIVRGDSGKQARARAMEALKTVGLADKADRFPRQLSGGQQQRVAVARALASDPAMVLADEPTANLDSTTAFQLIDLFQSLNEDFGMTFLFSTHDHRLMDRVKRQLKIEDGKLHG